MKPKIVHGICIGVCAALLALALHALGALRWVENPTWDWRVRLLAKPGPATDSVRLIFLDQTTLDWGEEKKWTWPWYREIYGAILKFCARGGAKAVVFDVLFTESSRYGVEDDQALGQAARQKTAFVSSVFLSADQGTTRAWPPEAPSLPNPVAGLSDLLAGPAAASLVKPRAAFPIPDVATNSAVIGNVYAARDPDAIVRRVAPFQVFDGRFVPSLGLAAYLAAHPAAPLRLEPGALCVDTARVPLDAEGNAILRFRGHSQTHKTVNAAAVIQSELRLQEGGKPVLDPSFFRDAYVFFGYTAPGLMDLKATPISRLYPGVEVHATLLDNLLSNDFCRDAPALPVACLVLALALLAGVLGRLSATGWQLVLLFVVLLPCPVLAGLAACRAGVWLPVMVQETAIAGALVGAAVLNYALEGRQKRFIKNAFKQYLSPHVIEQLVRNPERLRLGGEARELSIYFSDVQGFTTISESLQPTDLTALLNEYLTAMTDIIMEEGGTVDKYEGDAVIAFWNAPLDLPDHANCAVRAALRCQRTLREIRPHLKERYGKDIFARIGLNTGQVVIGNMGSHQRFNYTFLGDAGNLAARLEGTNKQFGTYILMSEFTHRRVGDAFPSREISRVLVVGKKEPIRVYEPLLAEDLAARAAVFDTFRRGLQAYYEGRFAEAVDLMTGIAESDPPARSYVRRCQELLAHPPQTWDGVWELKEK